MEEKYFEVVLLGIIFDPKERKILLGKRENDPNLPNLEWCFPGGRLKHGESIDKKLKERIKTKTGYEVKNLGSVFVNTAPEKKDTLIIYFLCEIFKGEAKPGDDLVELKWVNPKELENYRKRKMNTRLKEYVMNIAQSH